ncbi:hypothetical protein L210DRAFT_3389642 [Boletus edulis BED1]|uniref:Uncharacterized protein n=1 Tax=Boletus edulis BED1 TaxID=1328754 RepID=A0AAD4C3W8_BOLED|nr:hypothetical protein L210DRAFT_3389642 [Boletus edulis BED1]
MAQPAHHTKHLPSLTYPILTHTLHLVQSDDGRSNGTALWLGAQILSLYLTYNLKQPLPQRRRPRAVELGSGIGLTALVLSALGYDVLATDTRHVCNSVLRHNVAMNLPHLPATAGSIQVRELDWNVDSDRWLWNNPMRVTPNGDECGTNAQDLLAPPFDLIIASDTLYDVSLVQPFFRTVRALAASSQPKPLFLLALERRDPQLIDEALACAPMPLAQVPIKKVRRALERAGIRWETSDWEGVEIWKGYRSPEDVAVLQPI